MAVRLPLALAAVAVAMVFLLCIGGGGAEARVLLTLDDFGGVGDGIANDTQALLDAWNAACASSEEAVLAVPVGKAYRIWPVQLSGPCKKKLKLLIAGAIVAPSSPDEWAGRDPMKWLYIYGVDGLSVSGGGTIDGMGQQWWANTCKRKKTQPCYSGPRPKAVHFEECRDVSVQGVMLQNAQQFQLTFTRCSWVKASFLRVVAPADSLNTDGIHLNDTSHVRITDNLISTGDDCVSMVGNCSDVHVMDISCGPGHGISIGSLGKNRTTDVVENVRVDTCLLTNTTKGVRIKSWQGGMVRAGPAIREHRDEERLQPDHHRPILLRPGDAVRQPHAGGGGAQGGVHEQPGHVGNGAGDQHRVQRHRAVPGAGAGAGERQPDAGGRRRPGHRALLPGVGEERRHRRPAVLPRQVPRLS